MGRLNVEIIDRAKFVAMDGDRAILKGVFDFSLHAVRGEGGAAMGN